MLSRLRSPSIHFRTSVFCSITVSCNAGYVASDSTERGEPAAIVFEPVVEDLYDYGLSLVILHDQTPWHWEACVLCLKDGSREGLIQWESSLPSRRVLRNSQPQFCSAGYADGVLPYRFGKTAIFHRL
jgi:hypothetical protein